MVVGKALRAAINFYKKQCLPVITRKKKDSSKQAVLITYTLEKKVLQLLLLKVCESFLFGESKKTVAYLGLYESYLHW